MMGHAVDDHRMLLGGLSSIDPREQLLGKGLGAIRAWWSIDDPAVAVDNPIRLGLVAARLRGIDDLGRQKGMKVKQVLLRDCRARFFVPDPAHGGQIVLNLLGRLLRGAYGFAPSKSFNLPQRQGI